jgi:indolepyruvate ferredoxin oxidoreductase beta subunit
MSENEKVMNVVFAGLGGQGVLRASDILAEAVFAAGYDVKKSEIHGMSQRGGSVSSDVRYGKKVYSPMVPPGEADYLVILHPTQVDNNIYQLKPGGVFIGTDTFLGDRTDLNVLDLEDGTPVTRRNFNVGLLGVLSTYLTEIPDAIWRDAICANLPKKVHEENLRVFEYGRSLRA